MPRLFRLRGEVVVQQIAWTDLGHKDPASALVADPSRGGLWIGFGLGGVAYFTDNQVRESYAATEGLVRAVSTICISIGTVRFGRPPMVVSAD